MVVKDKLSHLQYLVWLQQQSQSNARLSFYGIDCLKNSPKWDSLLH